MGGPRDLELLFQFFIDMVDVFKRGGSVCLKDELTERLRYTNRKEYERKPNKVLILGSGGLSIGQAGEFDYSGSQVCLYSCHLLGSLKAVWHSSDVLQ